MLCFANMSTEREEKKAMLITWMFWHNWNEEKIAACRLKSLTVIFPFCLKMPVYVVIEYLNWHSDFLKLLLGRKFFLHVITWQLRSWLMLEKALSLQPAPESLGARSQDRLEGTWLTRQIFSLAPLYTLYPWQIIEVKL